MGKIPVITHRGVTVTETPAILAYLADLRPDAGLAPVVGDPQRGAYYRWLAFVSAAFEPAVIEVMMKREPVDKRMAGWGDYGRRAGPRSGASCRAASGWPATASARRPVPRLQPGVDRHVRRRPGSRATPCSTPMSRAAPDREAHRRANGGG